MLRKLLRTGMAAALSVLLIAACDPEGSLPTPEPDPTPNISISSSGGVSVSSDGNATAEISADGGSVSLSFNSATTWTATGGNDWCSVSPASGGAGNVSVTLTVKPNDTADDRTATIILQSGSVRRSLTLKQSAGSKMTVSPTSIDVSAEGGTYEIKVQRNVEFSFSIEDSAKGWVSVTGTKAMMTNTVVIAVAANEDPQPRQGVILFKSVAGEVKVIISQTGADVFIVAPNEVALSGKGGTFDITVTATRTYHLSSHPDWVSEVSVKDKVHTFSAEVNGGKEERSGVLVFCDDRGVCLPVSVKQAGLYMLSLEPQSLSFEAEGGSLAVSVKSTVAWKAESQADWCQVSPLAGNADATLTVTVTPFMQRGSRETTVSFTGEGGLAQTLKVSQAGIVTFSLSPTTVDMDFEGGSFEVKVSSSLPYHISSLPAWVTEVSSENKVHTLRVAENKSSESRSDVVVFCDEEGICLPCNVRQKGNPIAIDWTREFARKSLVMRFTATWCGYCPNMAKAVSLAQSQNPGKIEALNLHGSGSNLAFSKNAELEKRFNITGFPTGIVDGRRRLENYGYETSASFIKQYVEETESNYPVATTVGFESSFAYDKLTVNLKLYARKADNYRIAVFVTESGIVGYQADYNEGEHASYRHDHIARLAMTDVMGEAVVVSAGNSIIEKSWSVTVPSSYVKENLRVLVIVYRSFGSQKQVVDEGSDYGGYYVDNCLSGKAGTVVAPALVGEASGGNEDIANGNPVNW